MRCLSSSARISLKALRSSLQMSRSSLWMSRGDLFLSAMVEGVVIIIVVLILPRVIYETKKE